MAVILSQGLSFVHDKLSVPIGYGIVYVFVLDKSINTRYNQTGENIII